MLGRYTTGPLRRRRSVVRKSALSSDAHARRSSTCAPTPSPTRPPRCAARWPTPSSATTCSGTTRRSSRSRSARPSCRARRRACSWPAARWATWSARWRTCRGAARSSRRRARTSSSTRPPATPSSSARRSRSITARAGRDDGPRGHRETRSATPTDTHEPITALVVLENTHAHSMGQPLTPTYTAAVGDHRPRARRAAPRRRGAPVQRRGRARDAGPRARRAGGLGDVLPVQGPRLPGRVRRRRVAGLHLAGATRAQAASAAGCARSASSRPPGSIALRDGPTGMIERLADDHENARRLAEGLASMPGIDGLDPARVRTNFVHLPGARESRRRFLDAPRHGRAC